MSFRLFVNSSVGITIEPEYDMEDGTIKVQQDHRTLSGALWRYKFGEYYGIKFSLRFVNSSDSSIINSWWNSNTKLLWMEEGSTEIYSVVLTGNSAPIAAYEKPYTEYRKGVIELETY